MALLSLRLGKEALVAFTVIAIMLANLFVLKQTTLFTFAATSADALAIGSLLGFNLLQEFYSRALARTTIITTFIMLAMYAILTRVHLMYVPSAVDTTHESFSALLTLAPWLVAGSVIIWTISLGVDFILFGTLQRLWPTRLLVIRNYIAIGLSQLTDTFLHAQFLFWLGVIPSALQVFFISFMIKLSITLIATPLVTIMAEWQQRGISI